MPNFEHVIGQSRNIGSSSKYSYDKILAIYNPQGVGSGVAVKSARISMSIKDTTAFQDTLSTLDPNTYMRAAATDISNIFMPFETIRGNISGLPGFSDNTPTHDNLPSGQANFHEFLPMSWDQKASGTVCDRWFAPSGDALNGFISSSGYYGDTDRYRNNFDMRGIGMRLPMMGVGWGYTSDGNRPFPSGSKPDSNGTDGYPSGTMFFKGNYTKGWMVDPNDYVAAPIDFHYDVTRNVWTCAEVINGVGLFKVLMLIDDKNPGTKVFDYIRFSS